MSPPTGSWPIVRGVRIDVGALRRLAHTCAPERCHGARRCCAHYEVTVAAREEARIVGLLPHAARYAPWLRDGARDFEDPFEETEGARLALATQESGRCIFSYDGPAGQPLCALHSAALDLGQDPYAAKPAVCALWPLALSEGRPPTLSVQDDALRFPCNRRRPAEATRLHPGVAQTLEHAFGAPFRRAVEALLTAPRPLPPGRV